MKAVFCHVLAVRGQVYARQRTDFRYTTPMFGIRVLIYLLGIALVIWILFRLARGPAAQRKPDKKVDNMVACSHCGTFVPRNEALQKGDKFYCSRAHLEEDR